MPVAPKIQRILLPKYGRFCRQSLPILCLCYTEKAQKTFAIAQMNGMVHKGKDIRRLVSHEDNLANNITDC